MKRLNTSIPEGLHRRLKSMAAASGMTLADYIVYGLKTFVEQNTDGTQFRDIPLAIDEDDQEAKAVEWDESEE